MAAKLLFTLICDDARVEASHKLIVIGLYNYTITFPEPPQGTAPTKYALPQLCLVRRWYVDSPGNRVRTELVSPSGSKMLIAERVLRFPSEDNLDQEIIGIRGIVLDPGRYTIRTEIPGAQAGALEEHFEVRIIPLRQP